MECQLTLLKSFFFFWLRFFFFLKFMIRIKSLINAPYNNDVCSVFKIKIKSLLNAPYNNDVFLVFKIRIKSLINALYNTDVFLVFKIRKKALDYKSSAQIMLISLIFGWFDEAINMLLDISILLQCYFGKFIF